MSNDVNFSFRLPESNYLFGDTKSKIGDRDDRNLSLIMQVIAHTLNNKKALILLDPNTKNQQCHLNDLEIIKRMPIYDKKSVQEKCMRNEENRFFFLAFLISKVFNRSELFLEVIQKGAKELGLKQKKGFENELQGYLKHNSFVQLQDKARKAFISLVENAHLKRLSENMEKSQLDAELYKLFCEDLSIVLDTKVGDKVRTYPVFASLVETNKIVCTTNLALVMKISVFTSKGYAGTIVEQLGDAQGDDDIVLVCDGIATDCKENSPTVKQIRETAKKCSYSFFQSPYKHEVHAEKTDCEFCRKVVVDLNPYRQRIQKAMKSFSQALEAMGVDGSLQSQKAFSKYFSDEKKYPELSLRFKEGERNVSKFGVAEDRPESFALCHSYPARRKQALEEPSLLHSSPKNVLNRI